MVGTGAGADVGAATAVGIGVAEGGTAVGGTGVGGVGVGGAGVGGVGVDGCVAGVDCATGAAEVGDGDGNGVASSPPPHAAANTANTIAARTETTSVFGLINKFPRSC